MALNFDDYKKGDDEEDDYSSQAPQFDNGVYEDVYRQDLQPQAEAPPESQDGPVEIPEAPPPPPAPPPGSASTASTAPGPDSVNHGPPPGVSQAEWDSYLRRNPGDYYRGYHGAFDPESHGPGHERLPGSTDPRQDAQRHLLELLMERLMGGGTPGTGPPQSPLQAQILAQLQALIEEGSKPLGDISQTPQALASRIALDRGAAETRSAMAERRAAQGINLGGTNIDQEVAGIKQAQAEAQSQAEGKIAMELLKDKKDRLERALSLGAGIVSDEQRLYAQQQLNQVNTALQLFLSLLGSEYNYDYLGYLAGRDEANANDDSTHPQ